MKTGLSFIVYAPRFSATSGGSIVTHKLCDLLNRQGHRARLWPMSKPDYGSLRTLLDPRAYAYTISRLYRPTYSTFAAYDTPLARSRDIEQSIVIYPEVVAGNPLGAGRYVRWFLHRPGFHTGRTGYSKGDLFFCFLEAYREGCDGMLYGGELRVEEMFLDVYRQRNFSERTEEAYLVRKGCKRDDLPDLSGRRVLDGLDHPEMAEAFNRSRVCYFYDAYTQYTLYCAACGCIPVVVPLQGLGKEQWAGGGSLYPGVAYGVDDIPRAIATRPAMLEGMRAAEDDARRSVERFVSVVESHFSP